MAYTWDPSVLDAVTAFMEGDALTDAEKDTLTALATAITTASDAGWPSDADLLRTDDEEGADGEATR